MGAERALSGALKRWLLRAVQDGKEAVLSVVTCHPGQKHHLGAVAEVNGAVVNVEPEN